MSQEIGVQQSTFPDVRAIAVGAPFRWLAKGWQDFRARPLPSVFYGVCFAAMGWMIAFTFRNAYQYVSALVTGFFLVGPFFAIGLYDLSRRRQRGEVPTLLPTLDAWRFNVGAIGMFALVLTVVLLVWARASLVVFALFYTHDMPSLQGFVAQVFSLDNLEFLFAYFCVGGFFAVLVFAISVVSVPMMMDRDADGIVAVLTSLKAFGASVPAMIVWGLIIAVVIGSGFALWFVGLVVAVPVIGHATWHAYREIVVAATQSPEAGDDA
jgi:uncharacterized membrane protein